MTTHWTNVDMTDGDSDIPFGAADGNRIRALAEYRRAGCIRGIYLCDLETLQSADEGSDMSDEGPSVDEIDWTGFDAALEVSMVPA